jgi:pimeloyl-ACP methyl ester carboxylesterase
VTARKKQAARLRERRLRGRTRIRSIPNAGHRADFDAPEALAKVVLGFLK